MPVAVLLALGCEKLGLIKREAGRDDRREVFLTLSVKGSRALERLARWHRDEHRSLRGRLVTEFPEPRPESGPKRGSSCGGRRATLTLDPREVNPLIMLTINEFE